MTHMPREQVPHTQPLELRIALPAWLNDALVHAPPTLTSPEDRMRLVVELARQNIRRKTGGPFGAAVFDETGKMIAPGINLVERGQCSILHAEMVAIALAQKQLGRYDLSDGGRLCYELVTAAEPCAMCFGAIPWSGVSRVVSGARDADIRSIGFDEGPKLPDWSAALKERGIQVVQDILRDESISVLREYADTGGVIYNPRSCK